MKIFYIINVKFFYFKIFRRKIKNLTKIHVINYVITHYILTLIIIVILKFYKSKIKKLFSNCVKIKIKKIKYFHV